MLRRSPLKRGPWRRPQGAVPEYKRPLREASEAARSARRKVSKAEEYGAEYGAYLRALGRRDGCLLCGRRWWIVLHHVTTRANGGTAADMVPICQPCHQEGHAKGWTGLEARAGVDLARWAAERAAYGLEVGLLPVGMCEECSRYHSQRYLLDEVSTTTGEVRRVCSACAGEGPP